jgi:hypothetical protein
MVPPLEAPGRVIFTEKGMADAFELAVGWPMPHYMKPLRGSCSVFPADNPGERNKSSQAVFYQTPTEMVIQLADEIEGFWKEKYGNDPEMTIHRGMVPETFTTEGSKFNKGSITLGLYETYAAYRLISHHMTLDPVSGQIYLASRRGPVYPRPERPDPEKERLEAEREKRLLEEADREWEEKQRKWALEKETGK